MSGTVIGDYKPGLYVGNRPMHIMKTELVGIIPGTIVAALFAGLLSLALARGDLILYAPQANAFAAFAQIMLGGQTPWSLLTVGVIIGVFMELLTGMGTAFGLGMYPYFYSHLSLSIRHYLYITTVSGSSYTVSYPPMNLSTISLVFTSTRIL